MKLNDAKASPLAARTKKRAGAEVLLVGKDRQALHDGVKVPKLPDSFRGVPGDKADCTGDGGRIVVVGCGAAADFDG
ncbi:MAG TPA: hypothetical protein VJM11_13215, partial [Nevskiaceae bacterium]|nr:hypothetical protein [Nevskiaceae bacterium]